MQNIFKSTAFKVKLQLGKVRELVIRLIRWLREGVKYIFPKILATWYAAFYFFKKRIWPIIKSIFWTIVILAFLSGIGLLTRSGLSKDLSAEYRDLLGVLVSTAGTIVAIFFSLILIPLNQIASRYSPKFLSYLKKDWVFISIFVFSFFTLVYDVIFLLLGASQSIAIAAILLFVVLIFLIGVSLLRVVSLSNPYNSILIPSHKKIVRDFKKSIPKYQKELRKSSKKLFRDSEDIKMTDSLVSFQVDKSITDKIQEDLLPIREVAIKSIRDLDFEQAKNAIQIMMSIMVHYLNARKNFHSDQDPLLYFLYTELKLIAETSKNELKLRLHPFLVECWLEIGIRAAIVNVKDTRRMNNNLNFLVIYPVQALKDLCAFNLQEADSYAPGKACKALGDIGVQLMHEGYDHQAAAIIEELKVISEVSEQQGVKIVSGNANYAIMRIYSAGVSYRNAGMRDDFNYVYQEISKNVDNLLEIFLQKKKTTTDNMVLSPFIGSILDPFESLNFSRISEYALFSKDLDAFSLKMNLECILNSIKSLERSLELLAVHKDWYFSNQAIENLYRIVLNLLSYLNPGMAKDHILFYKDHPLINEELREDANGALLEALKVLCSLIKARADKYIFENDHIHVLFSIYIILLFECKLRPNGSLSSVFERVHAMLKSLLQNYGALPGSDSNDDLYKYFRLLVIVLKENDFNDLSQDFSVPEYEQRSRGIFASYESSFPKTMYDGQWILKRPSFQVNGYYYNRIEERLELDVMKFR